MSAHTPGPWVVKGGAESLIEIEAHPPRSNIPLIVAEVPDGFGTPAASAQALADAKLIAAAPALADALEALVGPAGDLLSRANIERAKVALRAAGRLP